MTRHLLFEVHGIPGPQGSKRHVGGGRMIESSAKVKPWREAVKWACIEANKAGMRFGGPVHLFVAFCVKKPKSAPKRTRTWPVTRSSGDIDKLMRATCDALTDAGIWGDDSQVVSVITTKDYTAGHLSTPGAIIEVSEVSDDLCRPFRALSDCRPNPLG